MSVQVLLEKPQNCFTNLDFISGKVVLHIPYNETISAIVVKLEGESKTRLTEAPFYTEQIQSRRREHAELEVHKLLYKTLIVFPSEELQKVAPKNPSYTLPAGQHVYPFQFKIPFNNECSNANSMYTNISMVGMRVEMARDTNRHVKKTLPPSLNGLPGQAEINYFVKATVQRPAFYKENFRAHTDFKFFPIEPPRPPPNKQEVYARRQHQFAPSRDVAPGLFRAESEWSLNAALIPPRINVEGRLPEPAILTCNEPLPLRVLVTKLNDTTADIFLQLIQITLISNTNVRAHALNRTNLASWTIMSTSNMNIQLGSSSDNESGKELNIDAKLWNHIPLPNTVAPSFETCNLSRNYFLDVKVGLAYGSPQNISPELAVQTVRMPVEVYSGIAPPQALLAAMANRSPIHRPVTSLNAPPPFTETSSSQHPPPQQLQCVPLAPEAGEVPEEAPPSYEDAMADDFTPVDGPRRDYHHEQREAPSEPSRKTAGGTLFP